MTASYVALVIKGNSELYLSERCDVLVSIVSVSNDFDTIPILSVKNIILFRTKLQIRIFIQTKGPRNQSQNL